MDNFPLCAEIVLREEGGFVNHAKDPGGSTNYGVTQATIERARPAIEGLPAHVIDLNRSEALEVYRVLYWLPSRCGELPVAAALLTFDSAIQHGVTDAVKFLQHGLGAKADGDFGPKTLAAVNRVVKWEPVLREMCARRAWHYMRLDSIDDVFGLGWARRLLRVYDQAQALA